jgi:hypothetical protein
MKPGPQGLAGQLAVALLRLLLGAILTVIGIGAIMGFPPDQAIEVINGFIGLFFIYVGRDVMQFPKILDALTGGKKDGES